MKKILKSTFLILLIIISMSFFTGCFGLTSNSSIPNEEYLEYLRDCRESTYNMFKLVYDDIDGSTYYSDIGYNMDYIESEVYQNNKKFNIKEDWPTGSMYHVCWIAYIKEGVNSYNLCYLEVRFNSNFKASKKSIGNYDLND